jgi:hypothetical protein
VLKEKGRKKKDQGKLEDEKGKLYMNKATMKVKKVPEEKKIDFGVLWEGENTIFGKGLRYGFKTKLQNP